MSFSPDFWVTTRHVGTTTTTDFTLTNTGVSGTGVLTLSVTPSGPFAISADGCTGVSLGPGKSCQVTVQFAPVVNGTAFGGLTAISKKAGIAGADLTGIGWLTGDEACNLLGGIFGADDQVHGSDGFVKWTCNDWVETTGAVSLLSRACQFTPPGTRAFLVSIVEGIVDATCYG